MVRLLVVGLVVSALGGVGGWALWPDDRPADPAGNGEEAAFHRWQHSQPHHWRYVVTPRK